MAIRRKLERPARRFPYLIYLDHEERLKRFFPHIGLSAALRISTEKFLRILEEAVNRKTQIDTGKLLNEIQLEDLNARD